MVDSNIHREHISPSEKGFMYKLKLEALKEALEDQVKKCLNLDTKKI